MFNDDELEDLLFAIHYLLEGASLTPHGIKKYKYLEQTLLNIKRGQTTQTRKPGWKTLSEVIGLPQNACNCEIPDFAPFIECQKCRKPPRH